MDYSKELLSAEGLKQRLIFQAAQLTQQSEEWVEKIISFQFKDAYATMRTARQVEISGFGKFIISDKKVERRIKAAQLAITHLEAGLERGLPEDKAENWTKKLLGSRQLIEDLKTKHSSYEV